MNTESDICTNTRTYTRKHQKMSLPFCAQEHRPTTERLD